MSSRAVSLGSDLLVRASIGGEATRAEDVKTIGEIEQEETTWALGQPSTTGCAFCPWTFTGTVAEGQEASRRHREQAHGITTSSRSMRFKRRRSPMKSTESDLLANVAKTRARGGAAWLNDQEEIMQDVREHAATTNGAAKVGRCKVEGCDNEPADRRGMYAGLCLAHKTEARAARRAAKTQASEGNHPPEPVLAAAAAPAEAGPREAPPGDTTDLVAAAAAVDEAWEALEELQDMVSVGRAELARRIAVLDDLLDQARAA